MPVRPLAGVTVVENDSFVAGPSACLALSQLGAEVIKIDPIGGGPDIDRWPITAAGRSIYWGSLNRNRRSVALNLRAPEGQELAQALITAPGERAGIFVENNVGRPFLSDAVLRERRRDLIHVKVQGSADGGPGVDYTVNAATGIPALTGAQTASGPVNHVLPAWDLLCGQAAVTAVTAGLFHRERTGEGIFEQIALTDVAVAAVANLGWYTEALQSGTDRPRHGNHIFGSFGRDFATADGRHVMVTAITARQWSSLVTATGMDTVITALETSLGTDFSDESHRYAHRETLAAVLSPWFAARTAEQVAAELTGSGVLWAPYATPLDVARTVTDTSGPAGPAPEAGGTERVTDTSVPAGGTERVTDTSGQVGDAAGVLRRLESPELGTMIVGAQPIRTGDAYLAGDRPTTFGADTEAVLADRLGLGEHELARLHDSGIIATGRSPQ